MNHRHFTSARSQSRQSAFPPKLLHQDLTATSLTSADGRSYRQMCRDQILGDARVMSKGDRVRGKVRKVSGNNGELGQDRVSGIGNDIKFG